jgi:hypothetical protein
VLKEAGFIWVKVLYDLLRRPNSLQSTFKAIFIAAEKSAKNEELKSWF